MPIKNIVFDVGGVIIKGNLYHSLHKYFKSKFDFDAFIKEIGHRQMSAVWDIGAKPFSDVIADKIKEFPQYRDILLDYDLNWIDVIIGEDEGTISLIKSLKENGYKLFIISNFAKEKFEILTAKYDFNKYFDGIIISAEVQALNPSAEIYEGLFSKFNLKPQECVFFDDLKENVEGAKKAGMEAEVFTDAYSARRFLKNLSVEIEIDHNEN
ncbi:MAG: HAD family phosphatase [Elusimicrobiota bacterium]|jgi:FMN phosphatase YigB (HAD superfamily)|nr:HAD family phosphatase [Elusimicrobiota bacterium]